MFSLKLGVSFMNGPHPLPRRRRGLSVLYSSLYSTNSRNQTFLPAVKIPAKLVSFYITRAYHAQTGFLTPAPLTRSAGTSRRTPVPLVSLVLSLRSPFVATAMACSDDRALGRVPAHGFDCGTLCRTADFRVGALLGLCRRGGFARVVSARVVFALVLQALLHRRVPSEGT